MSAEWREPVTFDEVAEALGIAPDQVVAMIRPSGQVAAFFEQNAKTWLGKLVRNDDGVLELAEAPQETELLRRLGL